MSVQRITHKKIVKYDTKSPNFKSVPKPEKEIDGNTIKDDIYNEKKHFYTSDPNGNLQMEQLMGKMLNKLDNLPGVSQTGTKAVEVDIKRAIAIGKVDASAVKSEEFKGKVNNKLDKLKALRNRGRSKNV